MVIEKIAWLDGYYQARLSTMGSCIIGTNRIELIKALSILAEIQNGR